MTQFYKETFDTPIKDSFDIIVAGGGASGMIAATAAARMGVRTLLIEREGCFGGMATTGYVAQFVGFFNNEKLAVRGIPFELVERIRAAGGSEGFHRFLMGEVANKEPTRLYTLPFNPEIVKVVADEMLLEAGVQVLLHSSVVEVMREGAQVSGVVVENIAGRAAYGAKLVIDCTGDSTVAALAGATVWGEEPEIRKKRQPSTLSFRLSQVDVPRFRKLTRDEKLAIAERGIASGELIWKTLTFVSTPGGSDAVPLLSRIQGLDMLDAEDVTQAELVGRQQVKKIVGFMKREVPGCEDSVLACIATRVGVRETRRTEGDVTLSGEDIAAQKQFDDSIALGCGPMDIHDSKGTGISLSMPPVPFQIPMRSLIPKDLPGVLVSGRGISATREANGGARHMATAMALGQAAGTLGALAVARNVDPRNVLASDVQAKLREFGAAPTPADCVDRTDAMMAPFQA